MRLILITLCLILGPSTAWGINWDDREAATRTLARCAAANAYLIHWSMALNNEGGMRLYAAQYGLFFVGNTFLNQEDGAVSGARKEAIAAASRGMREEHDVDVGLAMRRAAECRTQASQVVRRFGNAPPLFGKQYLELAELASAQMRGFYGF